MKPRVARATLAALITIAASTTPTSSLAAVDFLKETSRNERMTPRALNILTATDVWDRDDGAGAYQIGLTTESSTRPSPATSPPAAAVRDHLVGRGRALALRVRPIDLGTTEPRRPAKQQSQTAKSRPSDSGTPHGRPPSRSWRNGVTKANFSGGGTQTPREHATNKTPLLFMAKPSGNTGSPSSGRRGCSQHRKTRPTPHGQHQRQLSSLQRQRKSGTRSRPEVTNPR